jgi:hypothetical protein
LLVELASFGVLHRVGRRSSMPLQPDEYKISDHSIPLEYQSSLCRQHKEEKGAAPIGLSESRRISLGGGGDHRRTRHDP